MNTPPGDPTLLRALRERLEADAMLGIRAVPIPRALLARLMHGTRPTGRAAAAPGPGQPPVPPRRSAPGTAPPPPPAARPTSPLAPRIRPPAPAQPGRNTPTASPADPIAPIRIDAPDRHAALRILDEQHVRSCTRCSELAQTRTQTVFGSGNPDTRLVFVGEAPGEDEDRQGLPFVGRSGQLLTRMIAAMGLDREKDVYICNVLKCRPPNNRTPTPQESACCWPYLAEQLRLIAPRVIVSLGNPAARALLKTTQGISQLRGAWHELRIDGLEQPIRVMPTYHPSYLLRQGERDAAGRPPKARQEAWNDLKLVMQELGLPIPGPKPG